MRKESWRLSHALMGRSLPPLALMSCTGHPVDMQDLVDAVLYFYPGGRASPMERDTPMVDAVLHRAFRDRGNQIAGQGFKVFAVSSENTEAQAATIKAHSVTHPLVTDPECQLGQDLGLPTFSLDGMLWYQRITLVVCGGQIRRVFFPILSAHRNPEQVLSWIRVRVAR